LLAAVRFAATDTTAVRPPHGPSAPAGLPPQFVAKPVAFMKGE
jgi:hypothetical protein